MIKYTLCWHIFISLYTENGCYWIENQFVGTLNIRNSINLDIQIA